VEVVAEAGDGLEALSFALDLRPDVMLTDISMPGVDGLELARLTQQLFPAVVVVMVTGRVDDEALQQARKVGAQDYVAKPFRPTDLMAAAGRAIHLCGRRTRAMPSEITVSGNSAPELETLFSQLH
jgi:two-component system response regulator YesN